MPNITINGKQVAVAKGSSVLQAAEANGFAVPTLCYLKEAGAFASCMVCLVKDLDTGKLIPACSSIALEGMNIETESAEITAARKAALELMLSEHVGDCEAICRVACPAYVNIPEMIRQIKSDDLASAAKALLARIALPRVIGRICHAPCQKACKRGRHDEPVSIRNLERFVADTQCADGKDLKLEKTSGKKVGIIGSGPTGLSSAFYLSQLGYQCVLFEKRDAIGGNLRDEVPEDDLPRQVLDEEIYIIKKLGCEFRTKTEIGKKDFEKISKEYDAVVIATGAEAGNFALEKSDNGLKVEYDTFETSQAGVFAGGDALIPLKQTVRSVADGRSIAYSIDSLFKTGKAQGERKEFDSRTGKNTKELIAADVANASQEGTVKAKDGFYAEQASAEAKRCLNCDCAKVTNCKLRDLATEYRASQSRYKGEKIEGGDYGKHIAGELVFEPGKCIKCGICVRISQKYDEPGMTFIGRGITSRIAIPFDDPLGEGLKKAAKECIESCPTAALSWKRI